MKKIKSIISIAALISILLLAVKCTRKFDGLELATYPTTADVFIDGFSSGLSYAAFGTSKVTAFSVDTEVKYKGTASMKFEVPDTGDPNGGYVGGVLQTAMGRDLTGYNVLTFWAKASQPATLEQAGFGNDLGASKYMVSMSNIAVNTNWTKYYILLPDPSVLTQERGMFFYSAAPQNGKGYTFWIDEVKFEKLGTIAYATGGILNGRDSIVNKSETDTRGFVITAPGSQLSLAVLQQKARSLIAVLAPWVVLQGLTPQPGQKGDNYFFRWVDAKSRNFIQVGYTADGQLLNYVNGLDVP